MGLLEKAESHYVVNGGRVSSSWKQRIEGTYYRWNNYIWEDFRLVKSNAISELRGRTATRKMGLLEKTKIH